MRCGLCIVTIFISYAYNIWPSDATWQLCRGLTANPNLGQLGSVAFWGDDYCLIEFVVGDSLFVLPKIWLAVLLASCYGFGSFCSEWNDGSVYTHKLYIVANCECMNCHPLYRYIRWSLWEWGANMSGRQTICGIIGQDDVTDLNYNQTN